MIGKKVVKKLERMVEPYGWVGHIPFAFWIIDVLCPEKFVELGTHTGNSYFAFCQCVRDHQLPTRCFAVDSWCGDKHAGFYGDNVYQEITDYNEGNYGSFSRLLRMNFDDALAQFEDGMIDLLHIDGLHTYEAVKHDFENWLPKMSKRGVMLFHDINVRQSDFGVWKFWSEVSEQYPSLSFDHSFGLGVLAVGNEFPPAFDSMLRDYRSGDGQRQIKTYFACQGKLIRIEKQLEISEQTGADLRIEVERKHDELARLQNVVSKYQTEIAALQAVNERLKNVGDEQRLRADLLEREKAVQSERAKMLEIAFSQEQIRCEELQNQLNRMIRSSSWRLTKPLRKLTKSARKRSRKIRSMLFGKKHNPVALGHYHESRGDGSMSYERWIEAYDCLADAGKVQITNEISMMKRPPLISVVMPVYNPDPGFLQEAIESVREQLYPYWELCIADDKSPDDAVRDLIRSYSENDSRIKYVFRESNGHICEASNSAIALATGTFMALLDHDDRLHELALYYAAREILLHPDADLIYTDEDKIDEIGGRHDPYFKSDFNYDLFLNQNMICHLGIYRMSVIREIGGFRKGFEGSQDYDLALRTIEKSSPEKIRHIPRVLYHWRVHRESTAATIDAKPYAVIAAIKAVDEHLQRRNIPASVECSPVVKQMLRVRYVLQAPLPSVEIVVLTRDKVEILKTCIDSILSGTTYPNYRVTIVDNGSVAPDTLNYFESLRGDSLISIIRDDSPFNFSRLNNKAVDRSDADFICLLNNDIEVITPEWLDEMMGHAVQSDVGAVGARLWYPNKTLQHGGVIIGVGGIAGHAHKYFDEHNPGYFARAYLQQSYSAVTAACLVVARGKYLEVNGLDENNLRVAFNDVDFCLKLKERGYRNVWTPYAELYHHESLTRGYEDTPEKKQRFYREMHYMQHRWKHIIHRDPAYNPNLTLESENFTLSWPPRIDHVYR